MEEKVRDADAHSPKRWAAVRTTSSNQWRLGCDVMARRAADEKLAASSSMRGKNMDRQVDR